MRANDAKSRKTSVQLHESDECRTQSTTYWPDMPDTQRACLEHGLKLDLNKLARQGLVRRGARSGPYLIRWGWTHTGKGVASRTLTANMEGEHEGWQQDSGSGKERSSSSPDHAISVAISGILSVR